MMQTEVDFDTLELVGGELSLNFANTVGSHNSPSPNEHLTSYAALIDWSRHAGILSARSGQHLLKEADRRHDEAQGVLGRAIALREAIYRIFSAGSAGGTPKAADLAILNRELSRAMARARIVPNGNGFAWDWAREEDRLDQMLWPITRSAADLLTRADRTQVRECANDTCGWLFLDTSKNHSRRWCSMNDCGNRAKARRHYARLRSQSRPE